MEAPVSTSRPFAAVADVTDGAALGVPGRVLGGKYRLLRKIGRGGTAVVWLAKRLDWDAEVAVKITLPRSPLALERFNREVRTIAGLRSSHVVQILDHGVDETTGVLFIVMERLEGETVRGRLERLKVLSPGEVMMLVEHVGQALSRVHAAGVVHRDLKPENIFFVGNGESPDLFKVLDFGLAKPFEGAPIDPRAVTIEGHAVGTPSYMSPEQIVGVPVEQGGELWDLWSLAVIAFECLVGQRPFLAHEVAQLTRLLNSDERPVPSRLGVVPTGFDAWFARATHPDMEQRYQSAEELVAALRGVCGTYSKSDIPPIQCEGRSRPHLSSLEPVTRPSEAKLFLSRRSSLIVGLAGSLVVAVGGNAYFFLQRSAPEASPVSTATLQLLPGSPGPDSAPTATPRAAAATEAVPARSDAPPTLVPSPPGSSPQPVPAAPAVLDSEQPAATTGAPSEPSTRNAPRSKRPKRQRVQKRPKPRPSAASSNELGLIPHKEL